MTAIKAIRNLSFNGLGENASQVYKNLAMYYSVLDKVYYCEKYTQKIEDNIKDIEK